MSLAVALVFGAACVDGENLMPASGALIASMRTIRAETDASVPSIARRWRSFVRDRAPREARRDPD
jgi:hypothetical protein